MTAILTRTEPGCSWSDAYERAHIAPGALEDTEKVGLADAVGRVLAHDLRALVDLPGYDASAMDGYAVSGRPPWMLAEGRGAVPGQPWPGVLAAGRAVAVTTGAAVPPGCERVVPIEVATTRDGWLHAADLPSKAHVRRRGEETRAGDLGARAGERVTPALLGLAAATGHDALVVRRRPRVRVVVTGSELLTHGEPTPGMVRDAIWPMLAPTLAAGGGTLAGVSRVDDAQALDLSGDGCDIVVVTGSTSVGTTDRLRVQVAAEHRVVDGVDCRPGHPMLLARRGDGPWIVGLPGNPYAALVGIHTLLLPLIAGMTGSRAHPTRRVRVDLPDVADGTRVLPVRREGEAWIVCPGHTAASLTGAARAEGLAVVEAEADARLLEW